MALTRLVGHGKKLRTWFTLYGRGSTTPPTVYNTNHNRNPHKALVTHMHGALAKRLAKLLAEQTDEGIFLELLVALTRLVGPLLIGSLAKYIHDHLLRAKRSAKNK